MLETTEPVLSGQAKSILSSSSGLRGLDYLDSRDKRILDVVIANGLSLGALPVVAILAAAVFCYDRKNPLARLNRYNPKSGAQVDIWKIRSMVPNADIMPRNGEVDLTTPVGRMIRRTSLDELPQIAAVLRGRLSMIGPRIHNAREYESMETQDPEGYADFLNLLDKGIKFGITGLYGVMGRKELPLRERLMLDVIYGKDANVIADLRIIGMTVGVVAAGKGAR